MAEGGGQEMPGIWPGTAQPAEGISSDERSDKENMENQRDMLIERMVSEFGLLDKLRKSLTVIEIAEVKSKATIFEKNKRLLELIFENNKHQDLIRALTDTRQTHLVNWVRGNGEDRTEFGLDWPLRKREIEILDDNQENWTDLVDPCELLTLLFSKKVINKRQMNFIQSKRTTHEKNEELLNILRCCSLTAYFITIECLHVSNQDHIAEMLEGSGAVIHAHANLDADQLDEAETQIVREVTSLMLQSSENRTSLLLQELQMRIIAARRGSSIVLYIYCETMKELMYLCEIINTNEMKDKLEHIFNTLLHDMSTRVTDLYIVEAEIDKAKKFFEREASHEKQFDDEISRLREQMRHEPMQERTPGETSSDEEEESSLLEQKEQPTAGIEEKMSSSIWSEDMTSTETKALDATTVNYFYGRLSRHEAERILMDKGCCDGLFLLRLSLTKPDDYALAICSSRRVHHYTIERQSDGQVKMEGGKKYPGPLELIKHHKTSRDGLCEKPKVPCSRPEGMLPYVWPGVTISDLDNAIDRKYSALLQQGLVSRRQKMTLLPVVAKEMHKHQPWFFGQLSRDEAERYLLQSRLNLNGKYLVRERCDGSLVLSMLHQNKPWHYKVTETSEGKYNIELGPEFDTIMDLVTFYHNGGLLCRLTLPCERHHGTPSTPSARNLHFNPVYSTRERLRQLSPIANAVSYRGRSIHPGVRSSSESSSASPTYRRGGGGEYPSRDYHPPASAPPLPSASSCSDFRRHTYLDLEDESTVYEDDVYQAARRTDEGDMVRIRLDQLELKEHVGSGHFGSVRKASYVIQGQQYSVAVKTLKPETESQEELIKEAHVMSKLDNPFIIRLIGVCQPDPDSFMLVVELAPIGSLREYLKRNQETPMHTIVEFLHQVARGMAYLERHKVVHRDLAARNILLYTERHAKISDFGLSRNLGELKDYYESTKEEHWPIRWYPPEVLHHKKFASKSDVWSFGVTMWEATSYAETPYKGLLADEYREKLDQGYRMPRPPNCPRSLYRIMLLCWAERKEDRPNFREILQQFELLSPT